MWLWICGICAILLIILYFARIFGYNDTIKKILEDTNYNNKVNKEPIYTGKWKTEEYCRSILESHYDKKFTKTRPKWLINNETGRSLELDCYNEVLNIALEYNGEQHYKYGVFHKSYEDFLAQLRRDELKRLLCIRHGVYLIIVPYTVDRDSIRDYILERLPENMD